MASGYLELLLESRGVKRQGYGTIRHRRGSWPRGEKMKKAGLEPPTCRHRKE